MAVPSPRDGKNASADPAKSYTKLAGCIAGIVGSLLAYGVLQERIMGEPFGAEGEYFTYSLFLVLANRVLTFTVAICFLLAQGLHFQPQAPLHNYAAVSASNVLATTCQYEALKHVSLPVQTLGKCAKMIPVMLWGVLILKKTYSTRDYGRAFVITAGCTVFLASGQVSAKQAGRSDSSWWGVSLMAGYLACDGFTSTFQSRLFKGHKMTVYNQILYTTLISATYSLIGLIGSGQLLGAMRFIGRHPEALSHVVFLSVASTTGQLFIVHTISSFGPLLFAAIMTTRQFATILLSCLVFHHPLSKGQWLGTVAVFTAVLHRTVVRKKASPQLSRVAYSEAKLVSGGIAKHAPPGAK